jgi:hypothetical protein
MGAGNSVPLWLNPNGNPPQYDMWGYVPDGMIPPQHFTSQLYDLGFPDSTPLLTAQYKNSGQTTSKTVLWGGQQNDVLDTFGAGSVATMTTLNEYYPDASILQIPQFPAVATAFPGKVWAPDTGSAAPTCDPSNYPACYLSSMRDAAPIMAPYSTWWTSTTPGQAQDDYPWWELSASNPGAAISVMDRYLEKTEQHTRNYAAARYDGLKDVCSQDTSAYDPCTTGLFEKILPILLGGAGVAVLKVYGSEALAFLPAQSNGFLYATTFLTLYHIGAGVEAFSLPDAIPGEWKDDTAAAANSLALGTGAIVASYQLQGSPYVLPASIGGALLARTLLAGLFYRALLPVVAGSGVLSALPVLILHFVEKFFCWISNWGMSACDDFGQDSGFPDARRWDVPSLAARLTDIACDSEGWTRDSEQAKFVYRGLVLNPSWMLAATNSTNIAAGNTLWDGKRHVDPLGVVAPIHEFGSTKYALSGNANAWDQRWDLNQWVFTGNEQGGAVDPIAETNRFACQNFDILYWGDECGQDDDPECQGVNPPARCQHKCAENPNQEGSDSALSTNMQTWLKDLIRKAYDPANITAQFDIPGLDSTFFKYLPGEYDVATYLKTCSTDYDSSGKTGFNSVTQRGSFANYYLSGHVFGFSPVQETELIANNLFVQGNLQEAWNFVYHNWNKRNVTAYAHYVYRPKGPMQQTDFERWEGGYNEVRKWKDDPLHVNEGFSARPGDGPIPFLPRSIKEGPANPLKEAPGLRHLGPAIDHLSPAGPLHLQFPSEKTHLQPPDKLSPFLHEQQLLTEIIATLVKYCQHQNWSAAQDLFVESGFNNPIGDQGAWNHATTQQWMWGFVLADAAWDADVVSGINYGACTWFKGHVDETIQQAMFVAFKAEGDFATIFQVRLTPSEQQVVSNWNSFSKLFVCS